MSKEQQRLKLLHLVRIFEQETDENYGLTMPQIVERLAALDIQAERKALYRDLECLRAFGYDVAKIPGRPVKYALVNRAFSHAELLLLVDAVQSSRFLTQSKSNALSKSLGTLTSRRLAKELAGRIHVDGRITMQNESVFTNVDIVQRAISLKRKISFQYVKYDAGKKPQLQREGAHYVETPITLTYADGFYYVVVYNDKYGDFAHYRLDRMVHLEVAPQSATKNDAIKSFDIEVYVARTFGMFGGSVVKATLRVSSDAMGAVIDKFGKQVESVRVDEDSAKVYAHVTESPTFFGWLAQFGNEVSIESPAKLRDAYRTYLEGIVANYKG